MPLFVVNEKQTGGRIMTKKLLSVLAILSAIALLASCGAMNNKGAKGMQQEWVTDGSYGHDGAQGEHGEAAYQAGTMDGNGSGRFHDVLFDYDKYTLRDDARSILDSAATVLQSDPDQKVVIEGHTDERGTNEYNLALGEKRARATMKYLRSLGISPQRMTIITFGEEKPLCSSQNEACWQRNRRALLR